MIFVHLDIKHTFTHYSTCLHISALYMTKETQNVSESAVQVFDRNLCRGLESKSILIIKCINVL